MGSTYISHTGVLGMRWGVRRYQNPDGTLTELGKRHYAKTGEYGYQYKSRKTRSLIKKVEKQSEKGKDVSKLESKLQVSKNRDRAKQDYYTSMSKAQVAKYVGKKILKGSMFAASLIAAGALASTPASRGAVATAGKALVNGILNGLGVPSYSLPFAVIDAGRNPFF